MLRKLRLDRTKTFERALATDYMADMVVRYLDGSVCPRNLGCEQGEILEWDDLVIEHQNGLFEHIQVKRQETDFDDNPATRGTITRGPRTGQLQDLSVLDKAILSLTNFFQPVGSVPTAMLRKFTLAALHGQVGIKRDLQVRHLADLCNICRNPTTTAVGLATRASTDVTTQRMHEWLTTWCGFSDWPHIQAILKMLHIRLVGNEADLEISANRTLARYFHPEDSARMSILHYIDDNAIDVGATTPRHIIGHLEALFRSDRTTWTQYSYDASGPKWMVAGIHGRNAEDIEPASEIVPAIWSSGGTDRKLKVAADCPSQIQLRSLPAALSRLAIHLQNAGQALFQGVDIWRRTAYEAVAGTLGLEDDTPHHLPWIDHTTPLTQSDVREIIGTTESRVESQALFNAMNEDTWIKVQEELTNRISQIEDDNLLSAIERLWTAWRENLCNDNEKCSDLLAKLLHPSAEGDHILGSVRVGPRTVNLLVDALYLLLIVAVGLGDDDASHEHFRDVGAVRTIGLRRWGGPAGCSGGPFELDMHGDVLVGKEIADVVVLSGVKVPAGNILKMNMAETSLDNDNFAKPRIPLVVTNSTDLRRKLINATLDSLRAHFSEELNRRRTAREENIHRSSGRDINDN